MDIRKETDGLGEVDVAADKLWGAQTQRSLEHFHFEDWTGTDAVRLLQRYRDKYCVYNDDVQGTAGITLAGMINATKLKGTKLKDEKYLFLGAGSAGIGLADLLCSALV